MFRKQRMLSQWARHNASILTPIIVHTIRREDWRNASTSLLKCVSCGRYRITGPIVKYYDYNASKLLCYDCQQTVLCRKPVAVRDILAVHVNS